MSQEKCKNCGQLKENCKCDGKKDTKNDGTLGAVSPPAPCGVPPPRGQSTRLFCWPLSFKTAVTLRCRGCECEWKDENSESGTVFWRSTQMIDCDSCRKKKAEAEKHKALEKKDEQISYKEKELDEKLTQKRLAFEVAQLKKDELPDDTIAVMRLPMDMGSQMHHGIQANGPNQKKRQQAHHGGNSPFLNLGSNGSDMQQGLVNFDLNHETPSQNLQHEAENEHLKDAEEQIKLREKLLEKKRHEAAAVEEKIQSRYDEEQEEQTIRRLMKLDEVKIEKLKEFKKLKKKHAQ